jgi:hypothetical protein
MQELLLHLSSLRPTVSTGFHSNLLHIFDLNHSIVRYMRISSINTISLLWKHIFWWQLRHLAICRTNAAVKSTFIIISIASHSVNIGFPAFLSLCDHIQCSLLDTIFYHHFNMFPQLINSMEQPLSHSWSIKSQYFLTPLMSKRINDCEKNRSLLNPTYPL